jgi:hypothetical protein
MDDSWLMSVTPVADGHVGTEEGTAPQRQGERDEPDHQGGIGPPSAARPPTNSHGY